MIPPGFLESVMGEFDDLDLGDRRREERARRMLGRFAHAPTRGVPSAMVEPAEAEAAYRMLRNPAVDPDDLLEPHLEQSASRVRATELALVLHDTTEFSFSGEAEREGLGPLHGTTDQGFLGHFSIAATATGAVIPLGTLAVTTYTHDAQTKKTKKKTPSELTGWGYSKQIVKESGRWAEHIEQVATRCGDTPLLHVADSEADSYELLLFCIEKGHRFVFRMARNRRARVDETAEVQFVREIADDARDEIEVDVPLHARKASTIPRAREARTSRVAKLRFAATALQLQRPKYLFGQPPWLDVHVVHVREVDCPPGFEPVDWMLFTTEPIDSPTDVMHVVESYRRRWLIEEFFKALKTGCAMEKRELESFGSLTRILPFFVPIAYHMLHLRSVADTAPDEPATTALSPLQVEVLVAMGRLKPKATARDAYLAIAKLGGYINKQRRPGWQVLALGIRTLLTWEHAFVVARAMPAERDE